MSFPHRRPDLFKDFGEKNRLGWEWRAHQPKQLLEWGKVCRVGSWQVGAWVPCLRLSVPVPALEWLLPLPPERGQQISSGRTPPSQVGSLSLGERVCQLATRNWQQSCQGPGRGLGRGPGGEQCALCALVMLGRALVIFPE